MHPSEATVAFRVFNEGRNYLGIANIELPTISYMKETLNGAGLAGEIETPVIGMTESMQIKFTWVSMTHYALDTMDWTESRYYECKSALQLGNPTTGNRVTVPYWIHFIGRVREHNLGTWEIGKKHEDEMEFEVTRLEIYLDGQEKILIDKYNFIHRVNGVDKLAEARQQMGLNV